MYKQFAFIACPEQWGTFTDKKTGKPVKYRNCVAIFNELTSTDQSTAAEVVAARVVTYKVSSAADFDVRGLKSGQKFVRLYFDEYGRLSGLA